MRAIGYVRVSTQGQVDDGVSMDAQKAKIKAWADLNGYDEVIIYQDAGMSGKRADNREGLQTALKDIKPGDALVVYSLSRLARSTKDTIEISELLQKKEADLVSISERIDTTTAAGKMVFRMMAVLNEFERDQISERTKAALQHKKANGEKTGGYIPFGHEVGTDGKTLVQNENEQKIIRLIESLRGKGYSNNGIAKFLNQKGHQTKKGKMWNHVQIGRIIKRRNQAA